MLPASSAGDRTLFRPIRALAPCTNFARNAALVARPFVIQSFLKAAHINPTPARRALDEVLPLVLQLAA